MVGLTREQRAKRTEDARQRAKEGSQFGGVAYVGLQEQVDGLNAIDERRPDWRPATIVDHETQEAAPDNRQFAGDEGKAINQMVGRAAITENTDPHPHITRANNPPVIPDIHNRPQGEGDEIQLLRGYQPDEGQGAGQGMKRVPGEVIRVPSREAKRLVNLGAAKFVEAD
jgi:hypothetical protein